MDLSRSTQIRFFNPPPSHFQSVACQKDGDVSHQTRIGVNQSHMGAEKKHSPSDDCQGEDTQ